MNRPIKGIVGCELSGIVRDAFIEQGFDMISCDLEPTESPGPHIQGDILEVLENNTYDFGIFHPPCTFLSNSSACHLYIDKRKGNGINTERWINMLEGALFFKKLLTADIPYIAVENPVMHGHAKKIIGEQQAQTIQPYEHGHPESKRTCLWLKGFPKLTPSDIVEPEWVKDKDGNIYKDSGGYKYSQAAYDGKPVWANQTPSGQNKLGPSTDRAKIRSYTYPGIAKAFATQWGQFLKEQYYGKKTKM